MLTLTILSTKAVNSGMKETTHMRIGKKDKLDIQFLRQQMFKKSEAEVIHELIGMYKSKKIGSFRSPLKETRNEPIQKTLENYISLYEDAIESSKTWKNVSDHLAKKHNEDLVQVIQEVKKCQI